MDPTRAGDFAAVLRDLHGTLEAGGDPSDALAELELALLGGELSLDALLAFSEAVADVTLELTRTLAPEWSEVVRDGSGRRSHDDLRLLLDALSGARGGDVHGVAAAVQAAATVAGRSAPLTGFGDASRVEQTILLRYELALETARRGGVRRGVEEASGALRLAIRLAPRLAPRGELVLATVLEPVDVAAARRVWHHLIHRIPERPGLEPMGGRAALAMARSLSTLPDAVEARLELVTMAADIGRAAGDEALLAAALAELATLRA